MTGASDRRAAGAGFTLIEVLLVLAVIALVVSLLLPGVNSMLRSISEPRPDQQVWEAITSAREQALLSNRSVWLRFDPKDKALTWGDETEPRLKQLPVAASVQFLPAQSGHQVLLGGELVETKEMPAVCFRPDGTCDRFRVQIRTGSADPLLVAVDPWTCAPLLPAAGP